MNQKNILTIVVAGINKQNEWLLIKRERGDYRKKWALVGGKMQFDETIQDAILREIFEETGLKVKMIGIKSILNEKLKDVRTGETIKHFLIYLCKTEFKEGDLIETDEGRLRWFSKLEIQELKQEIIPSDYYMLNVLLERDNLHSIIEVELRESGDKLELGIMKEY